MRSSVLLFCILLSISANSQIGYENYYSEEQLQNNLKRAKTTVERLDALGVLAVHSQWIFKHDRRDDYFGKLTELANQTKDNSLIARSIWWQMRRDNDTSNAMSLIQFAKQHVSPIYMISGNISLAEFFLHRDYDRSERYILEAKTLMDGWNTDTVLKDSVRLQMYYTAAHLYVHKKDGVNAARYLLSLRDFAEQDQRPALKIQAMENIGNMYLEWIEVQEKATPWLLKSYEFYQKLRDPNKLLGIAIGLAHHYGNIENNELAKRYMIQAVHLIDSLHAYGVHEYWMLDRRLDLGLITLAEYMRILDSHFDNHLFVPDKMIAVSKAKTYLYMHEQLDSAIVYLLKAKALGEDIKYDLSYYYIKKNDYDKAIPVLQALKSSFEKSGKLAQLRTQLRRLSNAYKEQGNYQSAYNYLIEFNRIRDSLDHLNNQAEVASMEMEKEIAIQEAAIAEQKRLRDAEQSKIQFRNRVRFYSLLSGLVILLVIAVLLLRNNRQKQKAKTNIEKAYSDLKATQQQLIQSEKMASLGELTAGIAHEIQNPLNFVNNFSEVNKELIEELRIKNEKLKIEDGEVKDLINDIEQNLEKINHHGKRADAIVKGMLQHSRTSSGQKEPTDINALADEYLRLAYHGLRAKDKSFNAQFNTDFDNSLQKINVVSQEMGRVLLNIINNAFYAVTERKKQADEEYEPTVTVTTKKINGKIEIRVRDNGNGIPKKVIDKIFQPFFTTKPTGQGTGLGLSLAYDVVTKGHGGELRVETKEGGGSEFIVQLPFSS